MCPKYYNITNIIISSAISILLDLCLKAFKPFNSGEFTLFWRELLYVAKYAFCVLFFGWNSHLCYSLRLFHLCPCLSWASSWKSNMTEMTMTKMTRRVWWVRLQLWCSHVLSLHSPPSTRFVHCHHHHDYDDHRDDDHSHHPSTYLIFVTCTTCGAGVKFFSLVSTNQ